MTPLVQVEVAPPGAAPYRIVIGAGLGARLDTLLADAGIRRPFVVVSTPPIWRAVRMGLAGTILTGQPLLVPDGEPNKHLATVSRLYDGFVSERVDRGTTVVAVGGGVLGDTAGFAAATFLRGLPLVHVPTTLLAQVDSAIGGKVGVNHPLGKN
ncbi:MAG: iron-containing alcohol dehydrogenase, partial [Vicinamibacterales bacterium]|nr:iron-containing alcohol dehydrogenase [Vicinamibacterales bacterium]